MAAHRKAVWGARALLGIGLLAAGAEPAAAQADPGRMFRSVFTPPDTEREKLVVSFVLAEGYGDSPTGLISETGRYLSTEGAFTEFSPAVDYRIAGRRTTFTLGGRAGMRYSDGGTFTNIGQSVGAGVQSAFGRTGIMLEQTIYRQPYYAFTGIPVLGESGFGHFPELMPDAAAIARSLFVSESRASVSRQLQQHLWLTGRYQYRSLSLSGGEAAPLVDDGYPRGEHSARISLGRQLSRRTRIRLEYEYRTADYVSGMADVADAHHVSVGFDRDQAFNLTRYTTVAFTLGPALVQTRNGTGVTGAGDVTVRQQVSRNWWLDGSWRRGLVYAEGFDRPLMMNGYAAGLNGSFGRRVTVRASYGSSHGYSDLLTLSAQAAEASTKSARVSGEFALARYLGAFAEYWLFDQRLMDGLSSSFGEAVTDRQGVRVGLLFRVPLFSSPQRGTDDPR